MAKLIRVMFVLAVLVGLVILAGQQAAWASPPPPIDVTGAPTPVSTPYKLGGCVTGKVDAFTQGIKLNAAMLDGWNSYPTAGLPPLPSYYWTLPGGPADIFSCVVYIRLSDADQLLKNLEPARGTAEVCLESTSNRAGDIYFLDKFFNDKPAWEKVGGPFAAGTIGCVPALKSGIYAFYSPNPDANKNPPSNTTTTVTYTKVGTVQVPEYTTTVTQPGPLVLGGCVTGNVKDIPDGGRLEATLIKSWAGVKDLPEGVGEFYRCVAQLKFYEANKLVNKLAVDKGYGTICFAVPPQANGSIYFLDKFFNPNAEWQQIAGPFTEGIACGPADQTGLYGMVDKK
jgi:hypothetical protein